MGLGKRGSREGEAAARSCRASGARQQLYFAGNGTMKGFRPEGPITWFAQVRKIRDLPKEDTVEEREEG